MKNILSHAHKTGSWYVLGVLFKISDDYPHFLYRRVPHREEIIVIWNGESNTYDIWKKKTNY